MANTKGEKLRELRNSCGLSQADFGAKIGISRASVNSYENNINPLPRSVIWKISQATGIMDDYFDTDMSLAQAIEKYGIKLDMSKGLKVSGIKENMCAIYGSLNDYLAQKPMMSDFIMHADVLKNIFRLDGSCSYDFVLVNALEAQPFAKNGDVLAVARDLEPKNNDLVIVVLNGSAMVFKYRVVGIEHIRLENEKDTQIELSSNELNNLQILGVVKQKITLGF